MTHLNLATRRLVIAGKNHFIVGDGRQFELAPPRSGSGVDASPMEIGTGALARAGLQRTRSQAGQTAASKA